MSSEQIVTIQVETPTASVDSDQTQFLELVTSSPNLVQLPLIDNQLQSTLGAEPEPVITIELETPEEIPEDNTLDVNIQPKNESEDTLSSELFHKEDFPQEYFQTMDDSISSDENVIYDYNEIEPNTGTVNLQWNQNFQLNPVSNFSRDTELEDILNGWKKVENDEVPDHSPSTDFDGLNFSTESRNPEDFFNQLFDESMYTRMAQETNSYAHDKIRKVLLGRDPFEQMDHHTHRQHAWLGTWKDLNESDIKKLIAHLLIMSSIKKFALHNYWSTNSLMRTPFFRTYLSRKKFQDILWNFQVADAKNNPPQGSLNHDPLAKVRPLLEMCQTNFCLRYTPSKYISLDESTKDVSNFCNLTLQNLTSSI